MKKIMTIIACMITLPAFATSMCASNDTISIVLDPTINGSNSRVLDGFKLWEAYMPYGSIRGTSACLSANYGSVVQTITDNGELVIGGERNQNSSGNSFCYCKMTHPALSRWVFLYSNSASDCASGCAYDCARNVRYNASFRASVFGSVAAN